MKKEKRWHLVWIIGIYAILITVLYLVVVYKVKWEDKDLNKYLYFYNCGNNVCTSDIMPTKYYNSVLCEKKECPYIKEMKDNIVILSNGTKDYVYDYINNKVISDKYTKYKLVSFNYLIAQNEDNLEGIIDYNEEVIIDFKYKEITDYKYDYLAYKDNDKYGIDNKKENIHLNPTYDEIILINTSMFAYKENNEYYIASYDTGLPINNDTYDYIYSENGIIMVVRNKQVDFLNISLNSTLLMRINSYYSYKKEKERDTLNPHFENNFFVFTLYIDKDTPKKYIYDTKNNKLFTN